MYEQFFSNFSYVDKESALCVVRLNEPYTGIEVVIAKQFILVDNNGQQEIKFDYEVTSLPDTFTKELVESVDFIDLVRNIFLAILEESLSDGKEIYVQADE